MPAGALVSVKDTQTGLVKTDMDYGWSNPNSSLNCAVIGHCANGLGN